MKLPYRFPSLPNEIKLEIREYVENDDLESAQALSDEWGIKNHESVLNFLIVEVSSILNCVGACLLLSGAHGFEFQKLIIQHPDQTFTVQEWSDIGNETTETTISSIDLDLRNELLYLRDENKGRNFYQNADRKSGLEGRGVSIYIIVGSEAEKFVGSNLLLDGEYENNAFNRILCAVFGLQGKVTLV